MELHGNNWKTRASISRTHFFKAPLENEFAAITIIRDMAADEEDGVDIKTGWIYFDKQYGPYSDKNAQFKTLFKKYGKFPTNILSLGLEKSSVNQSFIESWDRIEALDCSVRALSLSARELRWISLNLKNFKRFIKLKTLVISSTFNQKIEFCYSLR